MIDQTANRLSTREIAEKTKDKTESLPQDIPRLTVQVPSRERLKDILLDEETILNLHEHLKPLLTVAVTAELKVKHGRPLDDTEVQEFDRVLGTALVSLGDDKKPRIDLSEMVHNLVDAIQTLRHPEKRPASAEPDEAESSTLMDSVLKNLLSGQKSQPSLQRHTPPLSDSTTDPVSVFAYIQRIAAYQEEAPISAHAKVTLELFFSHSLPLREIVLLNHNIPDTAARDELLEKRIASLKQQISASLETISKHMHAPGWSAVDSKTIESDRELLKNKKISTSDSYGFDLLRHYLATNPHLRPATVTLNLFADGPAFFNDFFSSSDLKIVAFRESLRKSEGLATGQLLDSSRLTEAARTSFIESGQQSH